MHNHSEYKLEFHISRRSRDQYQFEEELFTTTGNVIFANFLAARQFAQKMNAQRDLKNYPERSVRAGQINAMGLIDELLHIVVEQYRRQINPRVTAQVLDWVINHLGENQVNLVLARFCDEYPPLDVYRGGVNCEEYLSGFARGLDEKLVSNREIALVELLMLWLENANPAFAPFQELFSDFNLAMTTVYPKIVPAMHQFFETQPRFGPDKQNLIDLLRAPALAHPDSLTEQLEYIRKRWIEAGILPPDAFRAMLTSLDMVREEEKPTFGPGGPGPSVVYEYKSLEYWFEPERFSQDLDWMPNLVLIAKNTYVWMDQLSRKYKRPINRLDEIPEAEFDLLRRWGISGLWLIGLWERSQASQRIKQIRGNPDAVASAYSLFSYDIASDLGGEEAFQVLRHKAWKHGIRLASDMVPNHMGIDSRWVIEHPHWFLSLNHSPFPTYSYNGPNLSWDQRVGIFIEDHYYDNSDAAVVFKRVDTWTGDEKYIYHGNDGTSMPWNDTAQLNYLLPEVREAVIQTILHVARKFQVIRFDAAMTLAKRHYQRLWFPEPGSGGDIASRSEYGLSKSQFDEAFPEEFWREVVDRVAAEIPDTLLLAEAFWLMEGYFVRTLGMHRVYNSAFMNMLRDEKNQEYRLVIKNTIEFDPQILKRFVNFMNNPDERTSVDQFGKGDKYFGVCTMLATLPGLPMFGHGQIEGYTEKYGMEFRYSKWHEQVDEDLLRRHEREIFPLLRRRYLFAEASEFLLFDFYQSDGSVNEDVFAYANGFQDMKALVIYHNRYSETKGWINLSAAYPIKSSDGEEITLAQKNLSEFIGLHNQPGYFTIYRDHPSGLETIVESQRLCQEGFYLELKAYEYHVFLDIREVEDDSLGRYADLHARLAGKGTLSIDQALKEIDLQPVLVPFRELVNPKLFLILQQNRVDVSSYDPKKFEMALSEVEKRLSTLAESIISFSTETEEYSAIPSLVQEIRQELSAYLSLSLLAKKSPPRRSAMEIALEYLQNGLKSKLTGIDSQTWFAVLTALVTARLGELQSEEEPASKTSAWMDEWLFSDSIHTLYLDLFPSEIDPHFSVDLVRILVNYQEWFEPRLNPDKIAKKLLVLWRDDKVVQRYLKVNSFDGILWFNQEAYEVLVWSLFAFTAARLSAYSGAPLEDLEACYSVIQSLLLSEKRSEYQFGKLIS